MSDKWKRSQVKMKNSAVLGKLQFWLPTTSVEMLTTRESLVTYVAAPTRSGTTSTNESHLFKRS